MKVTISIAGVILSLQTDSAEGFEGDFFMWFKEATEEKLERKTPFESETRNPYLACVSWQLQMDVRAVRAHKVKIPLGSHFTLQVCVYVLCGV